ncbi:amino acid adenylation domain-containing protein [Demetria terragena]|uniref:amino acid adenylation domain-containing protein n=1 Tax=Demetria terragena TaxID=63959 RepID=UPI0003604FE1|nr:amino acid adenylation domain-containing protein [Demetria terragena]
MSTLVPEAADLAAGVPPALLSHLSPRAQEDFVRFGFGPPALVLDTSIAGAFARQVRSRGGAPAVVDAEGRSLTYAELDAASDAVAAALVSQGVRTGDRVGVFLTRSLELVVSILGTLKAGASWVPQDVRIAPESTLADVVRIAKIDLVLTHRTGADLLPDLGVRQVVIDALECATYQGFSPHCSTGGDDIAVVIFTSGTTGTPNGVQVSHANLLNTVTAGPAGLGIKPGMRVAQLLNIAFDMSVWEIFGALLHGATLVIRGADLQETAEQVEVIIATPSVLGRLNPARCRRVRIVAVAGERCPEALAQRWRQRTRFHNSCGPTEVTIVNTLHELAVGDPLTIGTPLPNTSVYVLDEDLRPVETGKVGEMWAGGACVTRGYLGNEDLTAQRYRPDPFIGGWMFRCRDLVSWTPDGRLLHHGRTDDQVKVRGFRVELDAVTNAMERAADVMAATTLLIDGRLVGVLVPHSAAERVRTPRLLPLENPWLTAVLGALADSLPYFYRPDVFAVVRDLPLTPRGKVDARALTELLGDLTRTVAA